MGDKKPQWKKRPDDDDLVAAENYLSLLFPKKEAHRLLRDMRKAKTVEYAAKDLLRASGLPLLPRDESRVKEDLGKLTKRQPLTPVLLVQGDMSKGIALIVADGYHRICAVCHYDENAPIPSRVARR